jgi:hypothetical protein
MARPGQLTFALLDIERRRQAEVSIAQAQASLQRVIETAPLAIALFDARTLRGAAAQPDGHAPSSAASQDVLGTTPEQCCPPAQAAALRKWLTRRRPASAGGPVRLHEWREETGAEPTGLGLPHHVGSTKTGAEATAAAAGGQRRDRAACAEQARACRPPSRSARCWCARCTTASRTTCRAWPACCSRTPSATPRWPWC